MILRDYQQSIYNQIMESQQDAVFQLETGGGKTPIIAKLNDKPTINIAHRNMLIEQISQTLTNVGIYHKIIGNSQIEKRCQLYQRNHGIKHRDSGVYVGTIQSIIARHKAGRLNIDTNLPYQIIIDECHHVANGNMWAKLGEIFPNARFIGATATPCRLDGQGLHKDCGGLFDELVQAEQLKDNGTLWLIANGYLADYEAYCPPDVDMSMLSAYADVKKLSAEFTPKELEKWADAKISLAVIGDIIKQYQKLASDKTSIVFCPTIKVADQLSQAFKKYGLVSTYIASTLSFVENMRRVDAFRRGEVQILCNVEMATEGFDLPSAECLIILRPTASFVLHKQMIGRVMRPKTDNKKAIIIDHVGNIIKHGLPDDKVEWTLHGTPNNKTEATAPCSLCDFVHNVYLKKCPNCGADNWMRSIDAEDARAVAVKMVDVALVRRVRNHFIEKERQELQIQRKLEQEQKLSSEITIHPNFFDYDNNAIGGLCTKLAYWFVDNIKQTDVSIRDINRITDKKLGQDFWISNFNIKDLKSDNPQKCELVLKKWLKSH